MGKKGDMRTCSNAKGEGKLFSFDVADDQQGEIKVTLFREGAETYFDQIHEGKTYTITRAQLKPANHQYNTCKNDYELTGDGNTVIEMCTDNIKVEINYDFKSVADLQHATVQST